MKIYCEQIGSTGPALVLLHGLAGNGAVWRPFLQVFQPYWNGKILVPDLRGHGRSPHAAHYGYGQHAADVAELLAPDEPVCFVAHSMGAVVALLLASGWYGLTVEAVLGFGTKLSWTNSELEKAHSLAKAPVRWFDARSEAAERFLRFSGLTGLVSSDAEVVDAGIREQNGRWRLAADPWTFSSTVPPAEIFRTPKTKLTLACGSNDAMVKVNELRAFDPQAVELAGVGHNLHVEAPRGLAELVLERFLRVSPAVGGR